MLLSKIRIYLELMRFIVCLSASLMAIVGYWLSIHKFDFSNIDALLAAIAVGTALAFGNALNDILDVKGDMISYPDRPIPRGAVSVAEAGWVTAFFLMVSLVCGFLVGWPMLLFTIILLATAALYDLWVSKIPILGKVLVAAWIALTLATGYFVAEAGALPVIPIVAAFLFILAREFIETISDANGDEISGRRSVYTLWGKRRVLQICLILVVMSASMLFIPLFTTNLISRPLYLMTIIVLLICPAALAILAVWRDQSDANIRNVAYWIGVIFFSSFVSFLWLV